MVQHAFLSKCHAIYLLRLGRGIILKGILEAFIEVLWKAVSYSCVLQFYNECPGQTKQSIPISQTLKFCKWHRWYRKFRFFFQVLYKLKIKIKWVCSFIQHRKPALKTSRFLEQNQFFHWKSFIRLELRWCRFKGIINFSEKFQPCAKLKPLSTQRQLMIRYNTIMMAPAAFERHLNMCFKAKFKILGIAC